MPKKKEENNEFGEETEDNYEDENFHDQNIGEDEFEEEEEDLSMEGEESFGNSSEEEF